MNFYEFDTVHVLRQLEAQEEGLTADQAARRLRQYDPNRIPQEKGSDRLKIFIRQFASPLIYILLIAALVTFLLKSYTDSGVILTVVLFNAVIGYVQEFKAEESVRALKRLMVPMARVLRGNKEKEVSSEDLVPGDVVLLASGSKVPADLRLTSVLELRIDESMLKGESLPAEKITQAITLNHLPSGDQRNMAFMGKVVVNDRGRGVSSQRGFRPSSETLRQR